MCFRLLDALAGNVLHSGWNRPASKRIQRHDFVLLQIINVHPSGCAKTFHTGEVATAKSAGKVRSLPFLASSRARLQEKGATELARRLARNHRGPYA
jgi:hypothetical protein